MQQSTKRISRRSILIAIATFGVAAATTSEVLYLSADPVGDEESFPTPLSETNQNSPPVRAASGTSTEIKWAQEGGYINDASSLNRTAIHGIVQVRTEDDIANALAFARANGRKVSLAGVRHSMGGHAFYTDAVVLDMRAFNAITPCSSTIARKPSTKVTKFSRGIKYSCRMSVSFFRLLRK